MIKYEAVLDACIKGAAAQNPFEVYCLLRLLETKKPLYNILEIGTYRAGLAAVFKRFFPETNVVAVDIVPNDHPQVEGVGDPTRMDNVRHWGIQMVEGNAQDSEVIDKLVALCTRERFDLTFIDASHDYASVKKDYEIWSHYSVMVGFHDVCMRNEVNRLWSELLSIDRTFALWKEPDSLGIGVLL